MSPLLYTYLYVLHKKQAIGICDKKIIIGSHSLGYQTLIFISLKALAG